MNRGILFLILIILLISSCGSFVYISKAGNIPPPAWYYPNKVETIRYIYFPDYEIYYDFYLNNYFYLNDGNWLSTTILPKRFYGINLHRSKQVRITNYYGDDLKRYHLETIIKRRNSDPKRYH